MAKRFIDTDLFKKQFVRTLKPAYKLFWIYITTDCNHAGIWECDFEVAQLRLGHKVDSEAAIKAFKDKIVILDAGSKWFIPSFILFQYGQLSDKNRAHINVISILRKYDLITIENLLMPLTSPLQGAKVMVIEKEPEQYLGKSENPLGSEVVKTIANEAWGDQGWRESLCMGCSVSESDLKRWMAQFNASISNDTFPDFSVSKYKKIFRGFLNKEISKGVSVKTNGVESPIIPARHVKLN